MRSLIVIFIAMSTYPATAEIAWMNGEGEPRLETCHRTRPATPEEKFAVDEGNALKSEFLAGCYAVTANSAWCDQLIHPNLKSIEIFRKTYGETQLHQLISPDRATWLHAYSAALIIKDLEELGINVEEIYNWWRPEPYNKNVDGASDRHPLGTAVDVRFATKEDQARAFEELCKMRAAGRLRAIGFYQTTAIHLGIADHEANTWGKNCP